MLPQEQEIAAGNRTEYAVSRDFCRIFAEDMDGLYTLCLLLTADPAKAERCFGLALEDCLGATRVFQEWTRSWARRAVIRSAVQMMQPAPEARFGRGLAPEIGSVPVAASQVPLAPILQLKTFERFVFVMSVLERCSDHDGTVLLGCSRSDYIRARNRALLRLTQAVENQGAATRIEAGAFLPINPLIAKTA
ncbi:MAG: hypothetical protein ACM3NO_02230 [Deltaproteobacteria bacterium]